MADSTQQNSQPEEPLHYLPLAEQARRIRNRELSAVALVRAYLGRIRAHNPQLNSFITVDEDGALEQARLVDEAVSRGDETGPLAGIPIAAKDSIPTKGLRTTDNSNLLANWVPGHAAAAVTRLKAAGAIIIGKANLNEFGWSRPSEADLAPPPWNPWNPRFASVGSSSGSGAAASGGLASAAIGTDGGGSIRLPGGAHGLIGFKPTHGLVSRLGMDHNSHSEISPLTRTVEDAALMLDALAGFVPEDDMSWPGRPVGYTAKLNDADVRGWRVGVPWKFVRSAPNEPEVTDSFERFIAGLESIGCEVVDVPVRGLAEARMANFLVLNAEAYQRHAKSLGESWDSYGEITRVYLLQGAYLGAHDLLNAAEVGRTVRGLLETEVFAGRGAGRGSGVRVIAMPTSPFVTAERSRRPGEHSRGINACYTAPFNITGHPSVSVPAGFSESTGLPIGAMLTSALHDDLGLLQLAHAHEQSTGWHMRHPDL